MTCAADVMRGVIGALAPSAGAFPTGAEDRVSRPGNMPTQPGQYPHLKLRFVSESKQSLGRHDIAFTTLVTIRVEGEVSEPVPILDDVNRSQVEAKLTALKVQVERAIINSYPLFRIVQQLVSVTTQWGYRAEDTLLGGIQSDYTFEIFESAEDFFPLEVEDLAEIVAVDPTHPGTGLAVATAQEPT